jgi:hypothetical protein
MKRVDELLSQIELKKEDYDLIQEEALSEEEMKELQKIVLNTIKQEQEGGGKEKIRRNTKIQKIKRWILPLVASAAITSTVIASVNNVSISQIFKDFFSEESTNIGESGKIVGITDSNQGITLNIQGIVGDNKTAVVMFDLTKEDGTAFSGNNVEFGKLDYTIAGKSVAGSYHVINQEKQSTVQRTLSLKPLLFNEMPENFVGSEATVKITDIIEIEEGYWKPEINLADYLEQHPECLDQQPIAMSEIFLKHAVTEEELIDSGYNQSRISKIMNTQPKQGIDDKKLNLALYGGKQKEWTIDNIGFVDGQLHIRMSGKIESDYLPGFKDAAGNEVQMTWSGGHNINSVKGISYYIFDIKDLENLKKATMTSYFQKELGTIKGQWEVPFTMDFKSNEKTIKTEQTISRSGAKALTIDEMILSNLALHVTYSGDEFETIPRARLVFKDGTEKEIPGGASFDKGQAICSYRFEAPIEIANVAAIKLNDVEVRIE